VKIDIGLVALQYFTLLFSLCVHEAAHAAMADARGDSTARFLGRVTLDPRKHADPLGTVILPLLSIVSGFSFLFGWAKPVPFNPLNLKNRKLDPVWIALAGPGSNLVIAVICALVMRVLIVLAVNDYISEDLFQALGLVFGQLILVNVVLILFNMIPVPPLDGHYLLKYFLPPNLEDVLERIGPFGIIIAIVVARPWLDFAMDPVLRALQYLSIGGLV